MDMRKIACAALIAAASISTVAATSHAPTMAPAPGPASDAVAALPAVGSLIVGGASLAFQLVEHLEHHMVEFLRLQQGLEMLELLHLLWEFERLLLSK
ncbi:hypothetical protein BUALT_Bualt01G0170500 [Buddleja alternifolia]|uniref:Uncharacterized protein n=1 Tax=Buddleja alternifolia TaxID=168488 RepID=A0AAV6Y8V5_9LAMI|nr:hypothetical protein BUALT_Bualt01G0170500 [Buddleja alternifolia]